MGAVAALALGTAACGDDDADEGDSAGDVAPETADGAGDGDTGDDGAEDGGAGDGDAEAGDDAATPAAGGAGFLLLGDEEIALGPGRCFLQPQEDVGGGGTIELTGQAAGTNAAGDEVVIDFTRFGEDSDFAGDDVNITIGDPFSDDAESTFGSAPIGTVSLDGNVLSGTDFPARDEAGDELSISFEISC